jgi:hypothetical protein
MVTRRTFMLGAPSDGIGLEENQAAFRRCDGSLVQRFGCLQRSPSRAPSEEQQQDRNNELAIRLAWEG